MWSAQSEPGPAVCGHRGAAAVAPENTLAGFRVAVDRGATWVEFDVRPTADGELVIHHDAVTAEGTSIGRAARSELPRSIPTLTDLVSAMTGIGLDLEMKTDDIGCPVRDFVELVVNQVDLLFNGDVAPKLIVTSFDVDALALVRQLRPAIPTGLLFHDHPADWAVARSLEAGHVAIAPWYRLITAEVVALAHDANLAVATWTVNKPSDIAEVAAAGVDMIIGDDPAAIIANLSPSAP